MNGPEQKADELIKAKDSSDGRSTAASSLSNRTGDSNAVDVDGDMDDNEEPMDLPTTKSKAKKIEQNLKGKLLKNKGSNCAQVKMMVKKWATSTMKCLPTRPPKPSSNTRIALRRYRTS